jgi:DNA-binding transcriptional ArsR family regulator
MAHWTFLSNHAQVLLLVARDERLTAKEMARRVGITERAVQRHLDDLEEGGYIARFRDGRNNRYEIHPDIPLRHPEQEGYAIRDLLDLFAPRDKG